MSTQLEKRDSNTKERDVYYFINQSSTSDVFRSDVGEMKKKRSLGKGISEPNRMEKVTFAEETK